MQSEVERELTMLCESCALCCDGSLFGRVTLEPDEVEAARKNHLHVLERATAFEQPCSALHDRRCLAYSDRPRACRRFTCRLYERHRREGGPLEVRLDAVRRVRALLCSLDVATLAELTQRLDDDFARAS